MEPIVTIASTAVSLDDHIVLRAWYVSEHRLPELFEGSHSALWARLSGGCDPQYRKIQLANLLAEPVIDFIRSNRVSSLHDRIVTNQLTTGSCFFFDGTLCSKGLSIRDRSPQVTLTSRKDALPDDYQLKLHFSKSGLVTDTAFEAMSGTKHLFVLASIQDVKGNLIDGAPYVVGNPVRKPANGLEMPLHSSMEVSPDDIDQFSGIDFTRSISKRDLNQLKKVPEKRVKEILCSLLSENDIPKDWGGEDCDIFTSNLRINGRFVTAAFLLKGPAKFHEMTMADCGKNGDQIVRLFNTGADLLVIQHCHNIAPAVRTHVRNAAIARMSAACRFMFLDGYRTLNIIRQVGDVT